MRVLYATALLLLAGCAHRNTPPPPRAEPISVQTPALTPSQPSDNVVVQPNRSMLDKLLGRTPAVQVYTQPTAVRAGKKSTITYNRVTGTQTNASTSIGKKATGAVGEGATATAIGKSKAPTAVGDSSSAIDNTKQGQRGGAGASGPGATATATTEKSGWPWWLYLALAATGGFIIYRGYKSFVSV